MRIALIIAAVALGMRAHAGEVEDVLSLWGAQGGPWDGHIEIYGPNSPDPQTVALTTRWDAVPDSSIVTKIETFTGATTQTSAVTLMYAGPDPGSIVTPYFVNGKQRDYHFAVDSVDIEDDTHWTIVVATPGEQETYEDRPARLRYVRTRDGNTIENTKEVRFLDDAGSDDYELRSFIRQTLTP